MRVLILAISWNIHRDCTLKLGGYCQIEVFLCLISAGRTNKKPSTRYVVTHYFKLNSPSPMSSNATDSATQFTKLTDYLMQFGTVSHARNLGYTFMSSNSQIGSNCRKIGRFWNVCSGSGNKLEAACIRIQRCLMQLIYTAKAGLRCIHQ